MSTTYSYRQCSFETTLTPKIWFHWISTIEWSRSHRPIHQLTSSCPRMWAPLPTPGSSSFAPLLVDGWSPSSRTGWICGIDPASSMISWASTACIARGTGQRWESLFLPDKVEDDRISTLTGLSRSITHSSNYDISTIPNTPEEACQWNGTSIPLTCII